MVSYISFSCRLVVTSRICYLFYYQACYQGFAEWLSITYGENIGVSLLCPQGVNTPMTEKIKDGGVAGINGMLEAEDVAKISLDQMA